ncbi:hypothetical protein LM900277_101026 [Listeria monocytogenes]|nr:hypothetical protein LM900277_101026 [Listeria monocytogenes]
MNLAPIPAVNSLLPETLAYTVRVCQADTVFDAAAYTF